MKENKCAECVFGGLCFRRDNCENYYPVELEAEEDFLRHTQEIRREEFFQEWQSYAYEYADDYYLGQ